jgi:hypothetical protein
MESSSFSSISSACVPGVKTVSMAGAALRVKASRATGLTLVVAVVDVVAVVAVVVGAGAGEGTVGVEGVVTRRGMRQA